MAYMSHFVKDSIFKRIHVQPAEPVTEILLRLLVKPLLKFSKSDNNKDFTHHRFMLSFNLPMNNLKDCSISFLLYDFVADD
ncbi:hypothetical protein H5410_047145 [Solanum commersonii]|uniref:Uncharacterized protein n=1 Tax=Solanum commersonii TaxID=4109 RepID=A0A9J5XGE2_SOLCO|nr:hypothetical protein H5410_047145 [Solanum commersonii]